MASTTLQAILDRARDISRVDEGIVARVPENLDLDTEEGRCITAAVDDFSIDKPRRRVKKVTQTGAYIYVLEDVITGWDETKTIDEVQYSLDEPREQYYDKNHWRKSIDINTEKEILRFLRGAPAEDFAIWYFEPHTVTSSVCTVKTTEKEAVAQKVAYKILMQAAAKAAAFSEDASLRGDGVDYKSLSERYITLANKCDREYEKLVDKKTPEFSPTFVEHDIEDPYGENVFHSPDYY